MKIWGFVDGEYKDLHAEIELLRGYRDEAEAEAAIASLAADRLRLTEEERKAVQRAIDALNGLQDLYPTATAADAMAAYKMQGLLERHKRTPLTPATPGEGSVPGEGTSEPLAVGRELCDRLRRMNDANENDGDIPMVSAACPRCGLTFSERVDRSSFTPEELEAVEWFAAGDETAFAWGWKFRAETLRGLLKRLE